MYISGGYRYIIQLTMLLQNVIHCSTPISCHCAHLSYNLFHPIVNAQSACRYKCTHYVVKDNKELLGVLYMVQPVSLIS